MAITNFVLTIVGVGTLAYLMKGDVRHSSALLKRNLKHIRVWLEEAGSSAEKAAKEDIKQVSAGTKQKRKKHTKLED